VISDWSVSQSSVIAPNSVIAQNSVEFPLLEHSRIIQTYTELLRIYRTNETQKVENCKKDERLFVSTCCGTLFSAKIRCKPKEDKK